MIIERKNKTFNGTTIITINLPSNKTNNVWLLTWLNECSGSHSSVSYYNDCEDKLWNYVLVIATNFSIVLISPNHAVRPTAKPFTLIYNDLEIATTLKKKKVKAITFLVPIPLKFIKYWFKTEGVWYKMYQNSINLISFAWKAHQVCTCM